MLKNFVCAISIFILIAISYNVRAEKQQDKAEHLPLIIPTFHCLSLYWSPSGGAINHQVLVKYRQVGTESWSNALSLRYLPIDTSECKGDYRGSIVNLRPGSTYEIVLTLQGTDQKVECRGVTWKEEIPVKSIVKIADRNTTLTIDDSGTPDSYVVYDGSDCTIDTLNREKVGIAVEANYVILRGFTIKNVEEHGIRIFTGHHIIIEDCDISKWGSESEKGWGKNSQASIFSNYRGLSNVVVQRCKMHHPTWDTNSWAEKHLTSNHPRGPQTVVFFDSEGNHVIRYNEVWSDQNHYFNDCMGAGSNGSYRGFPGADSDIYCNYIANSWDDGIEAEGGNQNVRIWGNYIEDVLMPIANAATSIGPLYIWRNISGRSYSPPGSSWDMTHGAFIKMGYAGGPQWMTGHMYVFNNTIFQEHNDGADGLGGQSRIIQHCTTRNNIFHVRHEKKLSISFHRNHFDNDFDYDLTSAGFPEGHQFNGFHGVPSYVQDAGFDLDTKTGLFQLAPTSKGFGSAVVIPNFCEVINQNSPDVGAHERGTGRLQFGIRAQFMAPVSKRGFNDG